MTIYYYYQLVDPRNNKPFYIGEGKKKRAWSHLTFDSGCNNPHKDRVIRQIQSLGLEEIVEILEQGLTKEQSVEKQNILIAQIGLENLTNICADANPPILVGEKNGFFGKTHTNENKKIMGNVNRGKDIKTELGKKSIRESMKLRWKDPNQRDKQIQALKNRRGEKRSDKAKESYRKSAAKRNANMTPEQRSARTRAGVETRKKKYSGLKRQRYTDDFGNMRFRWIPSTGQTIVEPRDSLI